MHAMVAELDWRVVGLVHDLFHRSTGTLPMTCCFQDVFTTPETLGNGVGRALNRSRLRNGAGLRLDPRLLADPMWLYNGVATIPGIVVRRQDL